MTIHFQGEFCFPKKGRKAWFGTRCKCILVDRYLSAAKEAAEQHSKNDGADEDVNLVLLGRKTIDAVSHTHDRGRDQKQNAQADDAATVAVTNTFEDRRQAVGGTGDSVKMKVIRLYSMLLPEIKNPSSQ